MGLFSRKDKNKTAIVEERQHGLGLLFNSSSNFSETGAMKLSAFYCGVNQISNALAMLPVNIVKYDFDEKQPIEHPLWKILNVTPDGIQNHFNAFKAATEAVMVKGNGYFYIDRDDKLRVRALRYINPDFVTPLPEADGKMKYIVQGFPAAVDGSDMIHLYMHCDEQHNGISILRYAYNTLMSAKNAEDTADKFYKGGAGLNGIIKAQATLTKEQKAQIREAWGDAFSNTGNGVAVLPQGLDYQPISVAPEDAQLLESREFNIQEIARFLGISPIKLFQLKEVSYNSMESTQLSFLYDTVAPYVQLFVEEFNRKLFKPSEVGKMGVMFDYSSALQTNRKELAEYYRTLITNGIMTVDEVRGQMGMAKLNTPGSTTTFIQLSYASANDIVEGKYIKQKESDQDPNQSKVVNE